MVVLSIVSAMRITLPSGTEAEIAEPTDSDDESTMGLVVAPDIFGLRPLFDDMVARLSSVWSMTVSAVEPFPASISDPTSNHGWRRCPASTMTCTCAISRRQPDRDRL